MPYVSNRTMAAAFLAVVVTALVLGAVVLFVRRDDNAPIQVMLPTPAQNEATAGGPSGGGSSQAELKVYVSGAVRNPGVYTLLAGDRLSDAMAAAGGAELAAVNLAQRLQDEGHYLIPRAGETPPPISSLALQLQPCR